MEEIRILDMPGRVAAFSGDREVGSISTPRILFHFPGGNCLPLMGIQAVGVKTEFRRFGVAGRLMARVREAALEGDYSCMAVSADHDNTARRLYARAGCVYLFTQPKYVGPLPLPGRAPSRGDLHIRPVKDILAPELRDFAARSQRPFFGMRCKEDVWWRETYGWYAGPAGAVKGATPPLGVTAKKDGAMVGFCERHLYWPGLDAGLFVPLETPDRDVVAEVLIRGLCRRAAALGEEKICFSISEGDEEIVLLLRRLGLHPVPAGVFLFGILDLKLLLKQLAAMLEGRLALLPRATLPARVDVSDGEQSGAVETGGKAPTLELRGSREVITRAVCGTVSAWESYLRGELDIEPRPGVEAAAAVQALFPAVPWFHPQADRW